MLRAVIYARFSSDMQREESIDAQVRACKNYCQSKGYLVVGQYVDEAKSGRELTKRDAYNQMLADALEDKFDIIIFHKIDRNSRNELNYYTTKDKLEKLGIRYEYAVQHIDASPEGQMMEGVLVSMAAYYSRNLSKETKKGLNENAYKAQFNGGTAPLGFRIVDKHYEIEPLEAEAVRLIFKLYLAGYSYIRICRELELAGHKKRNGKPFDKTCLYDILGNEKYMGRYTFNKTPRAKNGQARNSHAKTRPDDFIVIDDALPAIISKEDFAAVQAKRLANRHRYQAYKAVEPYLLSGKVICGYCGSAMSGHRVAPRSGEPYGYYYCLKKERAAGERCPQKYIRAEKLEKIAIRALEDVIFSDASMKKIAVMMREGYAAMTSEADESRKALVLAKAAAEKKLDNLYAFVENGEVDEYSLARMKKIKDELAKIKARLCETSVKSSKTLTEEEIFATLAAFKKDLESNADNSAKRFVVNLLINKITVRDNCATVEILPNMLTVYMVPRTRTQTSGYKFSISIDTKAA